MAVVPMGAMNPAGFVTAATEPSAQIDVSFGASSAATDSVFVDVVDGSMGTVTSMAQAAPSGAGTSNFTGLDLSSLAEGSLTITATVRDAAGNEATVGGSATKDTVIVAVTSAAIPAAAGNAENGISATNLTTVSVDVAFDAAADGTESATVVIEDGSMNTVSYGSQSIPMGGGTVSFGPMDATGLTDGMITITVTTIDPSGNSVDTVVNGVKDVSAPAMASAAAIPSTATNNPADFVNIATDGGARVDVTLGAGSVATDTVTVTLDDGMTSVQGQAAASAGAGTVSVTGIDTSSLAEGAITISVDVTDQAGNSSGAFAGTAATKDVTAPADPIVDPVTSPWNTITQDVTGSADAGVGLEVDGGAASATGTADMAGFYSVTVTLAAATTNSLTVRARDAAGNPSMDVTTDWAAGALDVTHLATAPPVPFTEVAATVGLADTGNADGGSFADIDGDGDLDLFVGQGAAGLLYVNDGTGSFTEESGTRGGPFVGDRGGVWGDYDNDGDLDLLTVDSTAGTTLYANDGAGVFTDVTVAETANIASATLTQVFWLDHDQDGFLDFFALDSNTANGNVVMVNQRGAMSPTNTFVAAVGTGAETGVTAPMSGAVADFDVDGDIDLLFGDGAMGQFLSNAAGSYSGVGGVSFDHSGGRSPITFVDYDNDGDFDLYIARGGASSVNQLWRNDGGSFTEVAVSAGLDTDVTADDVCWGDLDHDGRIDLYVGSNGANKFYLNRGDIDTDGVWEFIELSAATGIAINDGGDADLVQMADVDGDGDLDLFVGNEGTANVFYRNTLASARYLKVRVSGQGLGAGTASSDARGAVVTLKLTDGTIIATREISGGRGKGSQDSSEIHFGGIAPSRQYDVVISFPSGNTAMQTVTPRLLANQTLVISE
ncbi:MAG: FG-GAP-like repeat-containing protein [Planctomycetota bacterium]